MRHPQFALLEEGAQRRQIIVAGAERNSVDVIAPQGVDRLGELSTRRIAEAGARPPVARVDFDLFARLGVSSVMIPTSGRFFALVIDPDRDEIVPPARDRERAREILRLEIRDEENDRASRDNVVQIIERQARQCAAALRLEVRISADQTQRVRAAFFGGNEKLDLIRKEDQPDLIVVSIALKASRQATSAASLAFDTWRCRNFPMRSHPPPA